MSFSTSRIGKRLPLALLVGASLGGMPLASGPAHATQAPTPTGYTVRDLGTLGGEFATGRGLNMQGDVAGYSFTPSGIEHAFLFLEGSGENGRNNLGTLGGDNSEAVKPNNTTEVVGSADDAFGFFHAVIFYEGGITDLGTLSGDNSYGLGINNNGQAVGGSETDPADQYHAFFYDPGFHHMFDLGTLPGGTASEAAGVNDSQNTVGVSNLPFDSAAAPQQASSTFHATLWDLRFVTDLGTLGGPNSRAYAIDNNNNIVGESDTTMTDTSTGKLAFHAAEWRRASHNSHPIQDLGVYTGDFASIAYGVNNNDVAAGGSGNTTEPFRAVLFNRGRVEDLNNLVPRDSLYLVNAFDINDHGQITGYGLDNQDRVHAYLLTPDTHSRFHRRAIALSRSQAKARVDHAMSLLPASQRQALSWKSAGSALQSHT